MVMRLVALKTLPLDFSRLDQEREESMADEGGVSGAIVENQDGLEVRDWFQIYGKNQSASQNRMISEVGA